MRRGGSRHNPAPRLAMVRALSRIRRLLLLAVTIALVAYLAILLLLWLGQDHIVFPGAGRGDRPIEASGVTALSLTSAGGAAFRVVERIPPQPRALALCFVGNGEDLRSAAWQVATLATHGVAAVAPEYPGYGLSEGQPGVESLLATADAAADYAARRAAELGVPLVLVGTSLGSFCAVHVAAGGRGERMLLRAPPTTLVAAARARFWWLPVDMLLRHRFDSLSLAPQVRCPVLVVHGDRDMIVPAPLGRQLCEAFAGHGEFVLVPGAGHNDLSIAVDGPVGARVGAFLRGDRG